MSGALAAYDALPAGTSKVSFQGSVWLVSKTSLAGGKAEKLLARELGGDGYVSMNLYTLGDGRRLFRPCEMSVEAAEYFLTEMVPDQ